jgi:hypothetical protein
MSEPAPDEGLDKPANRQPLHLKTTAHPHEKQGPHSRARWLVTLGALLAGLVAFGVGEMVYRIIPAQKILQSVMMTNAKVMLPTPATENTAAVRNGALTFGLWGLCLSGALGVAGGLARRSPLAATRGGLLGAILGLALGAGLSLGLLPAFLAQQNRYSDNDQIVLLISLVMHGLIWGMLGASAGLAFAVGFQEPSLLHQASIAGFLGAVAGTVAFELAGGLFFPLAATHQPISETWPTRLLARLLVTLAVGGALMLVLPKPGCKAVT